MAQHARERKVRPSAFSVFSTIVLVIFFSTITVLAFALTGTSTTGDSMMRVAKGSSTSFSAASISDRPQSSIDEQTVQERKTVTITAIGDEMVHSNQLAAQYDASTNTYDFNNNYAYIQPYISAASLGITNLETTFTGEDSGFESYPTFNSPPALATALKNAGFDLICNVNNHAFDSGAAGVDSTLDVLHANGLATTGIRANASDPDYTIVDEDGVKIGVTAWSYGSFDESGNAYLNGIPADGVSDRANVFDPDDLQGSYDRIIAAVNEIAGADIQVVVIHWGTEYELAPNEFQTALAQMLCDAGVDIIIGSHPHVVQPVEELTSADGSSTCYVAYSLGNAIADQGREYECNCAYSEDGLMVTYSIVKENSKTPAKVTGVKCIPTWVSRHAADGSWRFTIVPLDDASTFDYGALSGDYTASYERTVSRIGQTPTVTCSTFTHVSTYGADSPSEGSASVEESSAGTATAADTDGSSSEAGTGAIEETAGDDSSNDAVSSDESSDETASAGDSSDGGSLADETDAADSSDIAA